MPATRSCTAIAADSAPGLDRGDVLIVPMSRRMVVQYGPGDTGETELTLYYGDKEISFDEPALFAFGEALARQDRFVAAEATAWGDGYDWSRVKPLLDQLLEEGVIVEADAYEPADGAPRRRPSPLPPASTAMPRWWTDCEAITRDLTGVPVELGHLELMIPVFRIAHVAVDADGRQVGEANVFPRALRIDTPTEWMTCLYSGTRYRSDRPMNVTALGAMRDHWLQMMTALRRIRAAFLGRYPHVAGHWTVGDIERLTSLVLAVPTYQLLHPLRPVANGSLHPALSSMFRVTDGVRMTMHQMLFVPLGEPTLPPDAPMDAGKILDYAERNYSFHSETGVCAGPRQMVAELLSVLLDDDRPEDGAGIDLDPAVAAALADVEAAFDYGLHALRAHAALFRIWPAMARAYEALAEVAQRARDIGAAGFEAFDARMQQRMAELRGATYLATEAWRAERERAYDDMYGESGRGLPPSEATPSLSDMLAHVRPAPPASLEFILARIVSERIAGDGARLPYAGRVAKAIVHFALDVQAALRVACASQAKVNACLGRVQPSRPFDSIALTVHGRLQGMSAQRLPYLLDEIDAALGVRLHIDADAIELSIPEAAEASAAEDPHSAGTVPAVSRA